MRTRCSIDHSGRNRMVKEPFRKYKNTDIEFCLQLYEQCPKKQKDIKKRNCCQASY